MKGGPAHPGQKSVESFMPTVPTFAVRETASLGIMGAPRVPPLNPSESIVLSLTFSICICVRACSRTRTVLYDYSRIYSIYIYYIY